jgi:hypothetical protein
MSWVSDLAAFADRWKLWARLKQAPDQIEALTARIVALEAALEDCPGQCCPFCGKRSFRLHRQVPRHNGPHIAGYDEIWRCEACKDTKTVRT